MREREEKGKGDLQVYLHIETSVLSTRIAAFLCMKILVEMQFQNCVSFVSEQEGGKSLKFNFLLIEALAEFRISSTRSSSGKVKSCQSTHGILS